MVPNPWLSQSFSVTLQLIKVPPERCPGAGDRVQMWTDQLDLMLGAIIL